MNPGILGAIIILGLLVGGTCLYCWLSEIVDTWEVSGQITDLHFNNAGYNSMAQTIVYFSDGRVQIINSQQLSDLIIGQEYTFTFKKNKFGLTWLSNYTKTS